MDELISNFLDFTGSTDPAVAKQYLDITNNDLQYAIQLFLEAGNAPASTTTTSNSMTDEELAKKLQEEAYGGDNVREADANVHRHETLVDDYFPMANQQPRPTDIFGSGRVGIFNQHFDEDEVSFHANRRSYGYDDDENEFEDDSEDDYEDVDDEDDEDRIIELGSDGEVIENNRERGPPRSRRRVQRDNRINELNSTQRRLANLFRPPFDIMEKCNIDMAKTLGRQQKKWILVNIQNATEFVCQVLNRDFWSDKKIKSKVRENFIFLQFQHDSPNGEQYINFYHVGEYPHIAILDPLTGERVHKFIEGNVPDVDEWIEQVDEFLSRFSLFGDQNPIVEHEVKFDPDSLTEEQQIEYAMKQSMQENGGSSKEEAIMIDNEEDEEEVNVGDSDPFDAIKPQDHNVDDTTDPSTRIQIRFPNGKRLVHKFKLSDNIVSLYEWLKFVLSNEDYGLQPTDRFTITNTSNRGTKLIECLTSNMEEMNLKNASLLLEKE